MIREAVGCGCLDLSSRFLLVLVLGLVPIADAGRKPAHSLCHLDLLSFDERSRARSTSWPRGIRRRGLWFARSARRPFLSSCRRGTSSRVIVISCSPPFGMQPRQVLRQEVGKRRLSQDETSTPASTLDLADRLPFRIGETAPAKASAFARRSWVALNTISKRPLVSAVGKLFVDERTLEQGPSS